MLSAQSHIAKNIFIASISIEDIERGQRHPGGLGTEKGAMKDPRFQEHNFEKWAELG